MLIFDVAVLGLLAAILLCGCKVKRVDDRESMFHALNGLRGLFALEIVIGHAGHFSGDTLLYMLGEFMLIGVAFFFFVSGFGLARSQAEKEGYLQGFLVRKCGGLLAVIAVCFLQNELLRLVFRSHEGYSGGFFAYVYEHINWYVWELLAFYLIFWAVYSYVRKQRVLWVSVLTVVLVHVLYYLDFPSEYYISAVGFPLGLLFYSYYDKIMRFLRSAKGVVFTGAMLLAGLCSLLWDGNVFSGIYLRNAMCLASIFILIYAVRFFRFGNPVLRFLGRYSNEIYFYQFICLELFSEVGGGNHRYPADSSMYHRVGAGHASGRCVAQETVQPVGQQRCRIIEPVKN